MRIPSLLLATRNAHKVGEIRQIIGDSCRLPALADFPGAPGVVEDADTFAGNARKKSEGLARWLAEKFGRALLPDYVLADDSGLEVDALGGAPGVHSARFAAVEPAGADNSSDSDNNAKLLRLLEAVPLDQRTARFRCVLALTPVVETGGAIFFGGVCEGRIALAPNGAAGFGYDPLFVPEGLTQSFAELGDSVKNQLSHRARALENLRQFLKS